MAAVAFEIEHGIDHVLDDLGTGDLAVLRHVADEQQRGARHLGVADERLASAARTWLTVPGAASSVSAHSVWMESMTTRSAGCSSPSVARIFDKFVSDASADRRVAQVRAARRAAAPARSLPRRRNRSRAARAARDARRAASSSVDLPMPGSPPIRIAEPGTMPPPVTRSSSAMPVEKRGASSVEPLSVSSLTTRPLLCLRDAGAGRRAGVGLLDERVPLVARGTFARPARRGRPAGSGRRKAISTALAMSYSGSSR